MTARGKTHIGALADVAEKFAVNTMQLETYLKNAVEGFKGPIGLQQFEGGQSNLTYLVSAADRKYVLRRKPPGTLLKSAHAVDREFRVMNALYGAGFPVPKPYCFCSDESVTGTMFYVMEHKQGVVFWDPTLPGLAPLLRTNVIFDMIDTLARLHAIDWKHQGLCDFGRDDGFFERQIARWTNQYKQSQTDVIPEMEVLADWLPNAIPEDLSSSIVHGDFGCHNILIDVDEGKVVAVLDWELSTIGHPISDLIYFALPWYRPDLGDGRSFAARLDCADLGIPTFDEIVRRYCEGVGRHGVADVSFYKAFNLFRLAAIRQGIVARAASGTATGSDAMAVAASTVRPLAQAAIAEARCEG